MDYSRVVAFDLSLTATGWASFPLPDGPLANGVFPAFAKGSGRYAEQQRLQHILGQVKLRAAPGSLVVVEDFAFARVNQAHQIGGLGYLVRYWLWQSKIPFLLVAPAALKKFTVGRGNANKAQMLKATYQRFGLDLMDDNIADASALCFLGRALVGNYQTTAVFQREVVDGLRKKYADLLN